MFRCLELTRPLISKRGNSLVYSQRRRLTHITFSTLISFRVIIDDSARTSTVRCQPRRITPKNRSRIFLSGLKLVSRLSPFEPDGRFQLLSPAKSHPCLVPPAFGFRRRGKQLFFWGSGDGVDWRGKLITLSSIC
eukprot:Lithocolla_globosa_v1_NODE_2950_length_1814_cov_32.370097.p3 type:complete len:135 gc:universal NODE_2950_length_1814_cov_32.370097:931-527(-)